MALHFVLRINVPLRTKFVGDFTNVCRLDAANSANCHPTFLVLNHDGALTEAWKETALSKGPRVFG